MTPTRGDLDRKRRELEHLNKELGGIHLKRVQRRRREVAADRQDERERIDELLGLQEETHDEVDRLEDLLERLTDENEANDPEHWLEKLEEELDTKELPAGRAIRYLIAEIDLLEKELERRRSKLEQHRRASGRFRARFERLDAKAERKKARRSKLERRKRRVLDRIEDIKRELRKKEWPERIDFQELLYHDPPHLHAFTYERDKLITVSRNAEDNGLRCGEFPPFDDVECVHVGGSGHYQTTAGTLLPCDSPRLNLGGDAGCAADFNDLDGGSDKEVSLYHELVERYL